MHGVLLVAGLSVLGLFAACSDEFEPSKGGTGGADSGTGGSSATGGSSGSEGGAECDGGLTSCGSACVDTNTSAEHCGACDSPCEAKANAAAACVAGECTVGACQTGYANCDTNAGNGCETDTTKTKDHCGACETKCGTMCQDSVCNDPIDITAGIGHTCVVLKDGSVWCWGGNVDGQLGVGDVTDRISPTKVTLPGPATKVSASFGFGLSPGEYASHTCAILADKSLYCWGKNNRGQLGTGDTVDSEVPKPVTLTDVHQISLGGQHTCATRSNKDLYCWGWNNNGQLGDGTTVDKVAPIKMRSFVDSFELGWQHTCDVEGGDVYCWGDNNSGTLGDGTSNDSLTPKFIAGVPNVEEVALGQFTTCARSASTLMCWGANQFGELGIGTNLGENTPQTIGTTGFTRIRPGFNTTGGIANGKVYMWGFAESGMFGDGTTTNSNLPKDINLPNVANLVLGGGHTCALTMAGQVLCWGTFIAEPTDGGVPFLHLVPEPVEWQ